MCPPSLPRSLALAHDSTIHYLKDEGELIVLYIPYLPYLHYFPHCANVDSAPVKLDCFGGFEVQGSG